MGNMRTWHDRYREWKRKVDMAMVDMTGLSCDDIVDYPYIVDFNAGVKPTTAAKYALAYHRESMCL